MHLQQRILVTGGSEFLGSHLCECLHNQLPKVIQDVKFADRIEVVRPLAQTTAA
jgi:nucleoside-diphosphate-sugar epimerase